MAGKTHEMLFQLNAQLGGSYNSTFKSAQSTLLSMQKEIEALNKVQSDIASYQKQQGAVEATKKKLEMLQQQYDNIQQEIQETEGHSSSLENKLLSKQAQIDKTSNSLNQQTQKLDELGNSLTEAGVDTNSFADESERLTEELGELKDAQEAAAESAEEFGASAVDSFTAMHQALISAGIVVALKEIAEWFGTCLDASVEFESAITGVYKTVDGTDEELQGISDGLKELSLVIPATTTELAAVAESAGQLGIATEDVLAFTEVMTNLGVTTNMSAEDASTALARFTNITGMAASNYENLGSTIVALGNNFATTESEIVNMATGLASAGTIAGLSETEILALAAAMSSVGIEAAAGSTAMTQSLTAMEKAVVSGGEDLELFAQVAGMSASEFASAWDGEPIAAVQAFIAGLGGLEAQGESATLILDELGMSGIRQSNMLKAMSLASDMLSDSIGLSSAAWEENVALSEEAALRYGTTESKLILMQNAYNNLKVAIGDNFAPALGGLYEILAKILTSLTAFVEQNPALIKAVATFMAIMGGAIATLLAFTVVVKLATTLSGAFAASLTAVGVTAAVSLGHIMAIVAAVAIVAAAVTAFASSIQLADREYQKLSATSKDQYDELQQLNAEYEEAKALYGETSWQAQMLAHDIDNLSAAYESSKQSLDDYLATNEELISSHEELMASYRDGTAELEKSDASTYALIGRLEELTSATDISASSQAQAKSIIEMLNGSVDGLSLSYEDLAENASGSIGYIKAAADAQAKQRRYNKDQEAYNKAVAEQEALEQQLALAIAEKDAAQSRYYDAMGEFSFDMFFGLGDANWDNLQAYYDEVDNINAALEENKALQEETAWAMEAFASSPAASLAGATTALQSLKEVYAEVYEAAYDSISGQLGLYNELSDDVSGSVTDLIDIWGSHADYANNYADNISAASQVFSSDIVNALSDGSEQSAAYLDSMMAKYDQLVAAYGADSAEVQAYLAETETAYAEKIAAQERYAETVTNTSAEVVAALDTAKSAFSDWAESMDVSDQAGEYGSDTALQFIQGFESYADGILTTFEDAGGNGDELDQGAAAGGYGSDIGAQYASGISAWVEQVAAAARSLANAAKNELAGTGVSITASVSNQYATGTMSAAPGLALVGEEGPELVNFGGGEVVYTAAETRQIMDAYGQAGQSGVSEVVGFAPEMMAYLSSASVDSVPATPAEPVSGGGNVVAVDFSPQYNLSGVSNAEELEAVLREHDESMRDFILEVLEESGLEAVRRKYG